MPAKRYYNISKSVFAVLFLLLGAYGGWFVFTKVLGKEYTEESFKHAEAADAKLKKDTVFVKVVDPVFNSPVINLSRAEQTQTDTAGTTKKASNPTTKKTETATGEELPRQSATLLLEREQQDISANMNAAADRAGDMQNKRTYKNIFKGWHVWTALGVAVIILLVAFFTRDDALANATLKDVPPAILEQLFAELHDEINLFRNPRKILRYRNAVSYHYFFFKQKGLDTPENVRKMMNLLLAIHRDASLVDTSDVSDIALGEPNWFAERFAKSPHSKLTQINLPEDNDVVMLVLKLNADMG